MRPGSTLLTHGHSRVVLALLRRAASKGQQFSVVVTEGRPDGAGLAMARALSESGIPATVIIDSAVAWALVRSSFFSLLFVFFPFLFQVEVFDESLKKNSPSSLSLSLSFGPSLISSPPPPLTPPT